MIRRTINLDLVLVQPAYRVSQTFLAWIPNGGVEKAGGMRRGWVSIQRLPSIKPDMMMVSPRAQKRGLTSIPLGYIEPKHSMIEFDRAVEVCHFQVNVTDIDSGRNGLTRHSSHSIYEIQFPGHTHSI